MLPCDFLLDFSHFLYYTYGIPIVFTLYSILEMKYYYLFYYPPFEKRPVLEGIPVFFSYSAFPGHILK